MVITAYYWLRTKNLLLALEMSRERESSDSKKLPLLLTAQLNW